MIKTGVVIPFEFEKLLRYPGGSVAELEKEWAAG